jgi:hypothetical protein
MRDRARTLHFAASVTLLACASFDFGCCAYAQQSSPASIVGRWHSLETSKGGIGEMFEFRSDGTFDDSMGADVEMPWRIESNQLILPPATKGGAEQKYSMKWLSANKLSLETEAGVTELARVGDHANAGNPIIGEWIYSSEMAGRNLEAHWLFYVRGESLLLIPAATWHGSYTISGSALHMKVKGVTSDYNFGLSGGFLTLSAPEGGHESHYARY